MQAMKSDLPQFLCLSGCPFTSGHPGFGRGIACRYGDLVTDGLGCFVDHEEILEWPGHISAPVRLAFANGNCRLSA
jgi:hypothetical protein